MIVDEILKDMYAPKPKNGGMDMSRTWMLPPQKNPVNEKVIVIDAGGTNFRSCLVSFDSEGKAELCELRKTFMPATEKVYSKEEFFSAVADRIDYLKNKADKIGFCFSYSIDMTRDHDAIPNAFSKEFKARSILGLPVGKNLVEELEKRGWNKIKSISVVNDTLCALMAGKNCGTDYASYIGFILGTGMNAAFIAKVENAIHSPGAILTAMQTPVRLFLFSFLWKNVAAVPILETSVFLSCSLQAAKDFSVKRPAKLLKN